MTLPEAVVPVPAATVVVLRPGSAGLEVLLTHRPTTMAFAAGMHVFPGGRVDAADAADGLAARSAIDRRLAAARLGNELDRVAALATHVAAIRELWEEAGILLADSPLPTADVDAARAALVAGRSDFATVAADLDLRLRTDRLQPLSRWVTPPGYPRRFDARFFATVMPATGRATIGGAEVAAIDWQLPARALEAMAEGQIGLWLPTSTTLQQLEHVAAMDELAGLAPGEPGEVSVEQLTPDVIRVAMPASGGVPGQPVNAYLVGRRRLVLVDPGDPTGPALERCLDEAARRDATITAIALTSVDPDHHAGAEALAERVGIPVLAGPGAGRRLPYAIREVEDEAAIEEGDVPIHVMTTPGLGPEHLAFVVGDGSAVLTGDLDGRRATRSIFRPVDDAIWRASRDRVDALPAAWPRLGAHA